MSDRRPNEPCPECGYLLWQSDQFPRMRDTIDRLRRELERVYAENGRLRAEAVVRDLAERDRLGALQAKCARQAKALRKMEEKVRRLGAQPYASSVEPE